MSRWHSELSKDEAIERGMEVIDILHTAQDALRGVDEELRRIHGAPHHVEDHGLAHAWVVVRAALYPAGSRVR